MTLLSLTGVLLLLIGFGVGYQLRVAVERKERDAANAKHDAAFARLLAKDIAARKARDLGALIHPHGEPCYPYASLDALIAATKEGK